MNAIDLLGHRTIRVLAVAMSVALATTPSLGIACSFQLNKMSAAQIKERAQASFRAASAVVDAEVEMPMRLGPDWKPGFIPAASMRVLKKWKGRVQETVLVVYATSCDIAFEQKGQKVRVLLTGEDVFHADQGMNGASVSELAIFNAEIDRLIGSRRSHTFAHFPGEEPIPQSAKKVR